MKISFLQVQRFRAEPADWRAIIEQLNAVGVDGQMIADALGLTRQTVNEWKRNTGPRYAEGKALMAMYEHFCKQ